MHKMVEMSSTTTTLKCCIHISNKIPIKYMNDVILHTEYFYF